MEPYMASWMNAPITQLAAPIATIALTALDTLSRESLLTR